ncbi:ATP-binding cassette domain-containing protein [[Collinsella] massiliensis]|uniref:ABC transporter n=1 Tax=[Collinsella] massiliensis TaxID=1232426 RepID=A0A1Y3XTC7_9ACTN|nr:ATP-binding cassette domain-containing protein [[Collinsella] massiliensis]OUN88742.1 ABC transporter [[Collinsella] massiliensis]
MNVIETYALTKAYGSVRAVDGLDMRVAQGDIYGFVGKNGAGKSTTMKMIAGLDAPTAGTIKLFGAERTGGAFSSAFSRIGALVEQPGLLPNFSAYENLMMKALSVGVVRPREQCRELLELVGLEEVGPRKAKKFSLGMKQRLGLALALVGSPDLLLLDEPFNGIDPEETRALRGVLMRLNHERGVTVVISSHVLDQLNRMATRFGVIKAGHMVREFTEDELHAACGSSVRVKTADPARSLAILEERLAGAAFRVEPDGGIVISGTQGARNATARFGGAAGDAANTGAPTAEDVSRALAADDQTILELSVLERDIEEYFVELMGGTADEAADAERAAQGERGR